MLFIALYDLAVKDVTKLRNKSTSLSAERSGQSITIGEITFVDDLVCLLPFKSMKELSSFSDAVTEVFAEWGCGVNFPKLEVLVAGTGPKAEKLHDKISRGEISVTTDAGSCIVAHCVKYLGSLVSDDGSNTEEIAARFAKARIGASRQKSGGPRS